MAAGSRQRRLIIAFRSHWTGRPSNLSAAPLIELDRQVIPLTCERTTAHGMENHAAGAILCAPQLVGTK